MNFLYLADGASADHRGDFTEVGVGRALIAHLRCQFLFGGNAAQQIRFVDGVRERLLAKAMLAGPHGQQSGRPVIMIGNADGDSVDLISRLSDHLAEVVELRRAVEPLLFSLIEFIVVDVADRDNLPVMRVIGVVAVALSLAFDPDATELNLSVCHCARV